MDSNKIIINNALKIYFGIVAYFFAMKLLGLENIAELRVLNFAFVIWGVNTAIKKNISENLDNTYLTNLSIGFSTSILAILAIAISLTAYITLLDPSLLVIMENSSIWGGDLTMGLVLFAILIEGTASSVICSFLVMQYWKKHKIESAF